MSSRRDEVLQTALELLDEVGIDDLTVRRLADRLGVRPGALYRHFESKRALLDAMVAHLVATGPDLPFSGGDWADYVREVAGGTREAMLAFRDGARLLATFYEPGPEAVEAYRNFANVLISAGLPDDAAFLAVDTVFCYVNGFTIEEQARKTAVPRETRDSAFKGGLDLLIAGIRAAVPAPPPAG
jgi:TetR/AcrR family tetracycline transcriptional repressor